MLTTLPPTRPGNGQCQLWKMLQDLAYSFGTKQMTNYRPQQISLPNNEFSSDTGDKYTTANETRKWCYKKCPITWVSDQPPTMHEYIYTLVSPNLCSIEPSNFPITIVSLLWAYNLSVMYLFCCIITNSLKLFLLVHKRKHLHLISRQVPWSRSLLLRY